MQLGAKRIPTEASALVVQAAPIIYSQTLMARPVTFDLGHQFFVFLGWSLFASALAGGIMGASKVHGIKQLAKGLIPLAVVSFGCVLLQTSRGFGELSFYMAILWGLVQAPAAILGTALGSYFLSGNGNEL